MWLNVQASFVLKVLVQEILDLLKTATEKDTKIWSINSVDSIILDCDKTDVSRSYGT